MSFLKHLPIALSIVLACCCSCPTRLCAQSEEVKARKSRLRIGKDTTVLTQPLTEKGVVNYVQSIDTENRKGVTVANNANVVLRQLIGDRELSAARRAEYYRLMGIPDADGGPAQLAGQGEFFGEDPTASREQFSAATAGPWEPEALPMAAKWVEANSKFLPLIHDAAARTKYYSPALPKEDRLYRVLLPDAQSIRRFSRLLIADAMMDLGKRGQGAALNNLLASHRLAGHVGNGWTPIELLVSYAVRRMTYTAELAYINATGPNRAKMKFWQARFRSVRPIRKMADAIDRGERFMILDAMAAYERGEDINDMADFTALPGMTDAVKLTMTARMADQKIDYNSIFLTVNKHYDRVVKAMREQDPIQRRLQLIGLETDRKKRAKALDDVSALGLLASNELVANTAANLVIVAFAPTIEQMEQAEMRLKAHDDLMPIAWALSAWYADKKTWPEELSELVPKYIAAIPPDRRNGQPLHFLVKEKTCRVYGVGKNLKDDSGTSIEDDPAHWDDVVELRR